MAITLTNPETRLEATTVKLLAFTANVETRYAEVHYIVGYAAEGNFNVTRTVKLTFSDNPDAGADYTFKQLINNVPEVRDLRQALETQALALNVFDGVVT